MTVTLRTWRIAAQARLEFDLDDVAVRALLDLFDQPLSPVERQAALLYVLGARSPKPVRATAVQAHADQALSEAETPTTEGEER